jgi:hypothetical protein
VEIGTEKPYALLNPMLGGLFPGTDLHREVMRGISSCDVAKSCRCRAEIDGEHVPRIFDCLLAAGP